MRDRFLNATITILIGAAVISPADALHGQEHRVIGLGDVSLAPALRPTVPVEQRRTLFVQFSSLGAREKLLVRIFGGAL
jgi:hypothetical protein